MKRILTIISIFLIVPIFLYAQSLSTTTSSTSRFIVPLNASTTQVLQNLVNAQIIANPSELNTLATVTPGAYKLAPGMTTAQVLKVLQAKPYMVWVVIPPGLRVEETANILASKLGWTKTQKTTFINYTNQNYNYLEGVYFPDTYLIPYGEDPKTTYNRFINKFNESFAAPLQTFKSQNFPWIKALTLASLVQREAANTDEMPLIAGILLNRIDAKMQLGVDATVQYIRGDKNKNVKGATTTAYWAPINIADKKINSRYNTYKYIGLPPHPIASPGMAAIQAVMNPVETSCLYYLHDNDRIIHCADTYDQHLENIEIYLK